MPPARPQGDPRTRHCGAAALLAEGSRVTRPGRIEATPRQRACSIDSPERRRRRRNGPLSSAAKLLAWAGARVGLAALRASSLGTARRLGEAAGRVAHAADRTRRARALDAI